MTTTFLFFSCSKPIVCISSNIFLHNWGTGWSSAHYFNQATAFSNIQIGWWKRRIILCANKDWHNLPGVLFHYCQSNFIVLLNTNKADFPLLDGLCTFPLLHPLFLRLRTSSFFFFFLIKFNSRSNAICIRFYYAPWTTPRRLWEIHTEVKRQMITKGHLFLKNYMLKYISEGQRQQH